MGPLGGIKVVEMAGLAPAPFCGMILADMGAQVLRVDRKGPADRGIAPPEGPLDRSKYVIELDVKREDDLAELLNIVEQADVFVEGFRPGVAERLGLGPQALTDRNSRLVYGRLTGWGQDGPLAPRAGHDLNYIALSGALAVSGRGAGRAYPAANMLGDFAGGGMLLALGIAAALVERDRSGRGQVVDAAMIDGSGLFTAFLQGMRSAGLWNEEPGQNVLESAAAPFYNVYECADGKYLAVGCVELQFYTELLAALGIDDPDLPFQLDRRGWPQLLELVSGKLKEKTRDEWAEIFADSDACVTPVLELDEVEHHPHNQARRGFLSIDGVTHPAPAPRFSRTSLADPVGITRDSGEIRRVLSSWGVR
ncbi:CoA transferase [Mycobacteroides stephanolepidis]|uniref:CoA transferase n=1 Tax=[Mycobacterium] stephanolepidis TaxID=1520670 RepID=A0A1Z4F0P8_9MYCO|nr:CaiB/BaiF CoA-transferase family protein [[Mycobacterium] stephanolepidis]BAX98779.1 CoA transferase [[Mycobacterium] stephanolepidis]